MSHVAMTTLLTSLCLWLPLMVVALDNGVARRPPMGWMSWVRFGCNIWCDVDADNCITLVSRITFILTCVKFLESDDDDDDDDNNNKKKKKLSYRKDSGRCVKRSFKVTEGHPLLCQWTRHI